MRHLTTCELEPSAESLRRALKLPLLRHADSGRVVDARGALGAVGSRELVLAELERHVTEVGPDVICGVANSGTAWAALLSERLGLRFVNLLLDGPRSNGLQRQLEPDADLLGRRCLLLDNWLATGNSIATAQQLVESTGAHAVAALVISAAPGSRSCVPVHVAFPYALLLKGV